VNPMPRRPEHLARLPYKLALSRFEMRARHKTTDAVLATVPFPPRIPAHLTLAEIEDAMFAELDAQVRRTLTLEARMEDSP
jgi:hypothetical protein